MKPYPRFLCSSLFSPVVLRRLVPFLLGVFAAQTVSATEIEPGTPLLSNGDFEVSTVEAHWPDHWSRPKAGSSSWEIEDGKRFLRINATAPGELVLVYRIVNIPSGVKAVELSLRARVIGLKCGPQPWFDARVMTDFKNAAGVKVKGARPISFRKDTDGWIERKVRFAVPEGAVAFEIMPSLFRTYSGTFDIDEIQLAVIDPAQLNPAPAAP
jgi:hypothetical protein